MKNFNTYIVTYLCEEGGKERENNMSSILLIINTTKMSFQNMMIFSRYLFLKNLNILKFLTYFT